MKHIVNPFRPIWDEPDEIITDWNAQDLAYYAEDLENNYISGDFDIHECIFDLKSFQTSFVKIGLLAYKVKVYKIWKKEYKSFKEFCEKALQVSHWQIEKCIRAARIMLELIQAGFKILPNCKSQCEPLWTIFKRSGTEKLVKCWQRVIDTTKPHNISNSSICESLGIRKKDHRRKQLLDRLREKAIREGMSLDDYLESILNEQEETEPVEPEKIEEWEEDVEALVEERDREVRKVSFFTLPLKSVWEGLIEQICNIFSDSPLAYSQ